MGEAVVRFTGSGLGSTDRALQNALLRTVAGAAGLAALPALATGPAVAERITRPVEQIIAVTRMLGRGDRIARLGQVAEPSELGELATAGRPPSAAHGDCRRRAPVAAPLRQVTLTLPRVGPPAHRPWPSSQALRTVMAGFLAWLSTSP